MKNILDFCNLMQIEHMDALFEAQFSPLSESGRALSKCGKCARYMKYISQQPQRLYCGSCEDVYYLPQKGSIKVSILIFFVQCTKFVTFIACNFLYTVILFLFLCLLLVAVQGNCLPFGQF